MTLSGRSYITCRSVLAAVACEKLERQVVSWEQVKSKDVLYSDG